MKRSLLGLLVATTFALALCGPAQAREFGIVPGSFATEISTTQAGAHPDLRTKFQINLNPDLSPVGSAPKDFQIELPKGLIGAPTSVPTCPIAKAILFFEPCPRESMIGRVSVVVSLFNFPLTLREPVYSVNPYPGEPAAFAFNALFPVRIDTFVRRSGDYGITVTGTNLTQTATLLSTDLTFWGVPADHSGPGTESVGEGLSIGGPNPNAERVPFLTNPTECSGVPLTSTIHMQPWYEPKHSVTDEYTLGTMTGCGQLAFTPSVDAKPTTNLAGTPSGLEFDLHLPQHRLITGANETQVLSVRATQGQFRVGEGLETSGDLPFNASAEQLQVALEELAPIGSGNVTVFGGPGDGVGTNPYVISFKGELEHTDVDQISAKNGTEPLRIALESGTRAGLAEVSTAHPGNPAGSVTEEVATSHLRNVSVTLPEGMTINPPAADGLGACSMDQVGIGPGGQTNGEPPACPDPSKIGTVRVVTPVLEKPLPGTVYLAEEHQNPFESLFAIYLVVQDPVSGVQIKLAGRVDPDPTTGQLKFIFKDNPELPIEDLDISLFEGPRAPLKTPDVCGKHTTDSILTPWSSPFVADAELESSFQITAGADGGACPAAGSAAANAPTFSAGTLSPTVKAFSPFVLKVTRADGTQLLKSVDTTLPKGLLAKLAGVSICSDSDLVAAEAKRGTAELAASSCPANSQVGTVEVGFGAGSTPLRISGKAFLAGPYKGAPASLAIITPAVAGPFDFGSVVVRAALYIDPVTSQARIASDPIPTILDGIPLDVRSVVVNANRPNFTLNPTNCNPTAVLGNTTSVFDQSVSFSVPFQVGDCPTLPFKPTLKLALKGSVHRLSHPSLTATLTAQPGDANIASAQVKLPKSAFLDNDNIGNVCTRVQFDAQSCPADSVYGSATATTPLVDSPLTGPVYLRTNPEHKLPDLVAALRAPASQPVEVDLAGKVDAVKGALRTTFESVPDVPVTKFSLTLLGGSKGLIEMSAGFCARPNASVSFDAQNGNSSVATPKVSGRCGKSKKPKKSKKSKKGRNSAEG